MKKLILTVALSILFPALAAAQGNAFNFQGRLNDGTSPANGQYDLQFRLYDAAAGGNQIGPQVLRPRTTLINGVFSVALDFGAVAFQTPNSTFIEIAVKPNGSPNAFTILGPRQQLTVVPYASRSQNSTNSDNAQNALNLGGTAASEYITRTGGGADFIRNSTTPTPQPNSNFNISGTGIIGGNLSVGGNQSLVGNQAIGGNVTQASNKYGSPKAMIRVNANGTIARCYNGVTGVTAGPGLGNCGYSVTRTSAGKYLIDFDITVEDRFFSVLSLIGGTNIGVNAARLPSSFTTLEVRTFITDVDFNNSFADNPFMVIVY